MKKTLVRIVGLLVLPAVILAAGRLGAESKEKKTPPQSRIGLVNLTYVIKYYQKYKLFQEEIKNTVEPFKNRDAKLRAQLDRLHAQAEKAKEDDAKIVQTKAEDIEEKAKKIQREMEDNSEKAKKILSKRSDDEMKILFTDVEDAVKRYALAHKLDLVMHYNDAIAQQDYMSAPNIARKINTAALMPIYTVPGIDISKDILADLNQRMHKEGAEE